jgi:tetraacyldisaccharide 4'-kinase
MILFKKLLSYFYGFLVHIKNFLYDYKWIDQIKVKKPVISVGNITMGGTGKTPIVDWLVGYLENQNLKIAVISKAYKSKCRTFSKVDVVNNSKAASFFGDEPAWLAGRHPQSSFYIAPSKSQGAIELLHFENPSAIIVDDGFQHRALHRDLDIVVLDATENLSNYQLLPMGRSREELFNLERADAVFISKSNFVSEEALKNLESLIPPQKPRFFFHSVIDEVIQLKSLEKAPLSQFEGTKLGLISGIGRPEQFELLVNKELNAQIIWHQKFEDHHNYTKNDLKLLTEKINEVDFVITTAKDAVKLNEMNEGLDKFFVLNLGIAPQSDLELFYESLNKIWR